MPFDYVLKQSYCFECSLLERDVEQKLGQFEVDVEEGERCLAGQPSQQGGLSAANGGDDKHELMVHDPCLIDLRPHIDQRAFDRLAGGHRHAQEMWQKRAGSERFIELGDWATGDDKGAVVRSF